MVSGKIISAVHGSLEGQVSVQFRDEESREGKAVAPLVMSRHEVVTSRRNGSAQPMAAQLRDQIVRWVAGW